MADLFLHLSFARRLRSADGLHPIVAEALARRASLVCLGAALSHLPQQDRRGVGFFRRLFSRGGDAARWQKVLAPGTPRVELVAALLTPPSGDGTEAQPGSMMRAALALGVLSSDLLDEAVGGTVSGHPSADRAAIERAQARLWLRAAVPNTAELEREWRPALELGDTDLFKVAIAHVDRAILAVSKAAPGEALIGRWLKGLASEVAPVAEIAKSAGLPAPLAISDDAARAPHFEQAAFLEKTQAAVARFVTLANEIAESLLENAPPERVQANLAVSLARGADLAGAAVALDGARGRWRAWLQGARMAALERGRNPKPAYADGEPNIAPRPAHTQVMTLADLPPETDATGAPPVPEMSGPNMPPPPGSVPPAPTMTQEVSIAQIEAEAFRVPPHTQEISAVQIEASDAAFAPPAHTQEVSVAQIEATEAPRSPITQPITADDVLLARAADGDPMPTNGAEPATAPAPTPAHTAAADPPAVPRPAGEGPPRE